MTKAVEASGGVRVNDTALLNIMWSLSSEKHCENLSHVVYSSLGCLCEREERILFSMKEIT